MGFKLFNIGAGLAFFVMSLHENARTQEDNAAVDEPEGWLTMNRAAMVVLGLTALLVAIGYMQGVRITL